jgi:hypothetical protein
MEFYSADIEMLMSGWNTLYKVNLNIRCKGTRNRSSKGGGPIDENLTGHLQRYVAPGYGRKPKHFYLEHKHNKVANNPQGVSF